MTAFNQTSVNIIELPDFAKVADGLPWVFDDMSLAHAIGIRNRTLKYLTIKSKDHYTLSYIPKKSGKSRQIHAPSSMMKFVQKRILKLFIDPLETPEHFAAYVKGRPTRFSAEKHAGKPLLIVMDLENFFPSTRRSWVRHTIQRHMGYPHAVSAPLSDLMTTRIDLPYGRRYVVPQGAPTSAAICNWVAHYRIDRSLLDLCNEWGFTYTRYADDLAFSHNEKLHRKDTSKFIKEASKRIHQGGYKVNWKKLRVAREGRQQRLLGMTINEKPNIIRVHYKRMRARLHHCKLKGFDQVALEMGLDSGEQLKSQIEGQLSYYHMVNPEKALKLKQQFDEALK